VSKKFCFPSDKTNLIVLIRGVNGFDQSKKPDHTHLKKSKKSGLSWVLGKYSFKKGKTNKQ